MNYHYRKKCPLYVIMAVPTGFEPVNARVKVSWLTACRQHNLEQVRGIEPPSSAWEAEILTIEPHLHLVAPTGIEPVLPP